MKYRHVVVRHTGGPEVLQIAEDELPAPIGGQVLVKILAADVGFSDVNIRRGRYPGGPRPPFTPGYAIVGVVERLGPDTSGPEAGQAVAALTFYGGYSQDIILPAQELYPVPAGVDPGEAVTLVLNYVAAYQMLHRVAHVAEGQRILVHGAAGGMGTAFLELGHLAGLAVYGTASKPKHALVQRLGATPIDYRAEDFVERIAALTGGAGVDAVSTRWGQRISSARSGRSATAGPSWPTATTKRPAGAVIPSWTSCPSMSGCGCGHCRHSRSTSRSTTHDRRKRSTLTGTATISRAFSRCSPPVNSSR